LLVVVWFVWGGGGGVFVRIVYHEGLQCALYIACHSMRKGINLPEVKAAGN